MTIATDVFTRHGARVEQALRDVVLAFFGFPSAHEDDTVRAVRATLEVRQLLAVGGCAVRAGIDAGAIVLGGPGGALRDLVSGPAVGSAYRLQLAAQPGEVLLGAAAQRLARGDVVAGPAREGWRVLGLVSGGSGEHRMRDAPMFGRDAELTLLRNAYRRCASSRRAGQCTVLGEPGIGKSRLAREFVASLGDEAQLLTGRCIAYGEAVTYLPLREALAEHVASNVDDPDAAAIAAALGLSDRAGDVQALFGMCRRYLARLAEKRPVVLCFEDVHWAEPPFLDLVDLLAHNIAAPVFVLCLARPELAEHRPVVANLLLGPLPARAVTDLVVARSGGVAPKQLDEIVTTASGNPLFAEQLLAELEGGSAASIPASLQGLLTMRLDHLGPAERDVLRCASVIGVDCARDDLTALLPEAARPFIERHVLALERKQLVKRSERTIGFRHVLIQRAAYESMTRADRSDLHARFAGWLDAHPAGHPDVAEVTGHHLEQAATHRRAGGLDDADTERLAERAGERLADAARQALARFDAAAAANLLGRARELLPIAHPQRQAVTQRLAEVSLPLGRFDEARTMLEELLLSARSIGDRTGEWAAQLEYDRISFHVGKGPPSLGLVRRHAREAAAYFAKVGDDDGLGKAAFLLGCAEEWAGRMTAAARAFEESLRLADRTDHTRERLASRWMVIQVLLAGPAPVAACLDRCRALRNGLVEEHPGVLIHGAMLLAMLGNFDQARHAIRHARELFVERFRAERMLMFAARAAAVVEDLAGDGAASERELRFWVDFARGISEGEAIAPAAGRLSLVLHSTGAFDEAAQLAEVAAEAAPTRFTEGRALAAAARALTAKAGGDLHAARRLAREAVQLASPEMPNLRADLLVALAGLLDSYDAAREEAVTLYRRKGNLVGAARLTASLL